MKRLTEQLRHGDGEQGQPSGKLESPDRVPVAPNGFVESARPYTDDDNTQGQPVEKRQLAGTDEALGQVTEGLDNVRTGLHPVVGRNFVHLWHNLLFTAAIAVLVMIGPGLPGFITFFNLYLFVAAVVCAFVIPTAIAEAIMNAWRKRRKRPPATPVLPFAEVQTFEAALPYLNAARLTFTIIALAFFAATTVSADAGHGEGLSVMTGIVAVCTLFADAIPLLIILRHRKETAQ